MTITVEQVIKPIEKAKGLPNEVYTNTDVADTEKEAVFFAHWSALTTGTKVPDNGSVFPIIFLGIPLLVVRNKDGQIRVFENVCRHRGMILVDKPAKLTGPITCPYHAWSYDLDGHLRATPHIGGAGVHSHADVDMSCLSLNEVRCHVWMDVVFVNIDGKAKPFEETHAYLLERWREFNKQPLYHSGEDSSFLLTLNSNWKLAIENYCESYHLPFIHPSLNSYSRLEDHYHMLESDFVTGQGSLVYNSPVDEHGKSFPDFDGLSEKWDKATEYPAVFPNLLLGFHKDQFYSIIILPEATGKTSEYVTIYYPKPETLDDSYAAMRRHNYSTWKDIFIEDIGVVEGMFKGRSAPSYDGGKFSPVMDGPTHHFHVWIAKQLSEHQEA